MMVAPAVSAAVAAQQLRLVRTRVLALVVEAEHAVILFVPAVPGVPRGRQKCVPHEFVQRMPCIRQSV